MTQRKKNSKMVILNSASDVYIHLKNLGKCRIEYIYGLYLDKRNRLLTQKALSKGNANSSVVMLKDIFYPAILSRASSIILVHNHPSKDPTPSKEDSDFTVEVKKAASILQISLLDHVIISKNTFFSFNDEKTALEVAFKAFLC